jgi:hypothetical protein
VEQLEPSFERDIRPLFRPGDVDAMSFAFDLSSYEDVRAFAEEIYGRLAEGSMPCDAGWPAERVELFRRWIDAGAPS